MALVHSPAEAVNARVQRLIEWKAPEFAPTNRIVLPYALYIFPLLAGTVMTYSGLLLRVHEATEWLVR